jgi:hypothetical protein
VFGSRFLGGPHRVHFFWHMIGNKLLTLLSNMCTDLNLTDMETCYKMVRADLLKGVPLRADRFGFEPEVTARLAQARARIYELPISYHGRSYEEGKKISWKDGVAALWYIFRSNFGGTKARSWTRAELLPGSEFGRRASDPGGPLPNQTVQVPDEPERLTEKSARAETSVSGAS